MAGRSLTVDPEGGELGVQVLVRALAVLRRIVRTHRHRSALVVVHKRTNQLLVSSLLGFDTCGYCDRLDQNPAALTILEFVSDVRVRPRLFNDISHYEKLPECCYQRRLSRWWNLLGQDE